jgi:hypothetical protein
LVLSDAHWDRLSGLITGRPDQKGSTDDDAAISPPAHTQRIHQEHIGAQQAQMVWLSVRRFSRSYPSRAATLCRRSAPASLLMIFPPRHLE